MGECEQCAGIDINKINKSTLLPNQPDPDAQEWALKDSHAMSISARDGCKGCKFFLDIIALELNDKAKMDDFIQQGESISIAVSLPNSQHVYQIKANCFEDSEITIIGKRYPNINLCLVDGNPSPMS